MTIIQLLSAAILVPASIGTVYFSRLPDYGKMIVWFMYASLVSEILSILFASLFGNNMIVFYFYSCAIALCIGVAYSKVLKGNLKIFYLVPVVAIIESFVSGHTMFNSFSFTVLNLLIIGVCLLAYHKMIFDKVSDDIFCFNGVLMFSAMSNLLFYFTAVFLQKNDIELMKSMFWTHSWINMVTNLAYGYSLWVLSRSYTSAR